MESSRGNYLFRSNDDTAAEVDSGEATIDIKGSRPVIRTIVLVCVAVVSSAALAFKLLGTGAVTHLLVLLAYGAVSLALGVVLTRGTRPAKGEARPSVVASPAGSASAAGASSQHCGAAGGQSDEGNTENVLNGSQSATPSPLDWVRETVECSFSWLRGSSDRETSLGQRRRSSSMGDIHLRRGSEASGRESAVSSPGAAAGRVVPCLSPVGAFGLGRGAIVAARSALPALGPGIPQGQRPPRSRMWPMIGGTGQDPRAGGSRTGAGADDSYFNETDSSFDDDGSVRAADVHGQARGSPDWLVGESDGDGSETASLSSTANGARGNGSVGTTSAGLAELNCEVDGRRQMLRRSSTSAGVPTQDSQMVQDLLEMISDKPVDHAGQWRPVRVRRGIHIWTSTVAGSPYCRIRGRMRCEATPAQLLSLLIDDDRIGEYDWMFDQYELVERPNDHTSVRWTSYRAIWPTRPRDFIIRSTWEEFADGTIVIATRSVEHDEYRETPTFVRGKMVMCGYVICPLGDSRRRRRSSRTSTTVANDEADAAGHPNAVPKDVTKSPELRPSSEFTMYAHTDLGGNLPASVINKLCKKPAYRVLRKIQDIIETGTLVKVAEPAGGNAVRGRAPPRARGNMSRHDSEDILGSLLAEGMPDHEAAANLEDSPEGELERLPGQEMDAPGKGSATRGDAGTAAGNRRGSASQHGPSNSFPVLPPLPREAAMKEAQRIMKTINRMASDEGLGWTQLGVASHSDMALYKSLVAGTKKVRLGASSCVSAESSELLGILLENAAMLGPDYIVDRQELLETFSSGVNTGEGYSEAAARAEGEEPQHDTAIYWFSCTHKRQRICRDFVILRCFRSLPGQGGVIAYSSVDHPGLPPCADYVRGKLDVSGFVIVPSPPDEDLAAQSGTAKGSTNSTTAGSTSGGRRRTARHRRRRRHWRRADFSSTGDGSRRNMLTPAARRRSRSVNYIGSEEEEYEEDKGGSRGLDREASTRSGRKATISEVTFFTHLTFSAVLPDIQEMEACRHFVGPLHILQELKWVVERTLGSSQDDEMLAEAAAALLGEGPGDDGTDWGRVSSRHTFARRRASDAAQPRAVSADEAMNASEGGGTQESASDSVYESESAHAEEEVLTNKVLLRVEARREAALRDMLAFSSDGEGMDGPQVDWRVIRDSDGMKLWTATVPGTVWCMIRTRAAIPAPPGEVLAYLLNDACIPEYDELFDKIEVVEPVDDSSTFKRTCYKPIWPTAPRDFSLLSSWGTLEDGTSYLLNRSVDHPMNPPKKGFVRGVVMLCGFLMVPRAPEAGGGCTTTMIVHTDLGGRLPAPILNMLSTSSPWRLMLRLREAFQSPGGQPGRAAVAAAKAAAEAPAPRQSDAAADGAGEPSAGLMVPRSSAVSAEREVNASYVREPAMSVSAHGLVSSRL